MTYPLTIRGIPWATALQMLARPRARSLSDVRHMFLCVADHFEPFWETDSKTVAAERVDRWVRDYPRAIDGIRDSSGRPAPQHTFFYPAEDYDPSLIDQLARLTRQGYGDVEVHLHHDQDTSSGFRQAILDFTQSLWNRHGLLNKESDGRISYAFIHGNWALDNARPDGRWCGVNDEISILVETGCYADMTLPCAPEPGQTRTVNSIYYAVDDPAAPKSHDQGVASSVARRPPSNGLLLIQGPLAWDWRRRKWGIVPRIENGDLHQRNSPTMSRCRQWQQIGASVRGRPDWVFIKLHTHGAIPVNSTMFLNGVVRDFHAELAKYASQSPSFQYHYVTAREMAAFIHQAEAGLDVPELDVVHTRERPSA